MTEITLASGHVVQVSPEDYAGLARHTWYAIKKGGLRERFAIVRSDGKSLSYMHRDIMNAPKGMVVDHINGDALDNRRENLRVCTQAQNTQHGRRHVDGSSQFLGVSKAKRLWTAEMSRAGRRYALGSYVREEDAARVRDLATMAFGKGFGVLNFTNESLSG